MTLVSGTRACCFRNSRPRAVRRCWRSTISVAHRRLACQHRLVADGYTPFVLMRLCSVRFRNYVPVDEQLRKLVLPPPKVPSVVLSQHILSSWEEEEERAKVCPAPACVCVCCMCVHARHGHDLL